MFEKKQFIYSETMGVCKVVDIVRLSTKKDAGEGIYYYHLKAVADRLQDAYIPVERHEVQLRELISKEEASSYKEEDVKKLPLLRQEEITFVLNDEKLPAAKKATAGRNATVNQKPTAGQDAATNQNTAAEQDATTNQNPTAGQDTLADQER